MTGPFTTPAGVRAARHVRLLKRAGGLLVAAVGLIALVVGIVLLASRTWPTATGTVQSCTTSTTGTGTSRTTTHMCVVTWMDGTRQRTASVDVDRAAAYPGTSVEIRWHGDTAVVDTPAWVGYVTTGVGVVLLAVGIFAAARTFRSAGGRG